MKILVYGAGVLGSLYAAYMLVVSDTTSAISHNWATPLSNGQPPPFWRSSLVRTQEPLHFLCEGLLCDLCRWV
jgi:hypothetical protein